MKKSRLAIIVYLMSLPSLAEPLSYTTESGIEIFPHIGAKYLSDDNIARTSSNEVQERVETLELNTGVSFEMETNRYLGQHIYSLAAGDSSDGRNDYFDHHFVSKNKFELNSRHRLDVQYIFNLEHEARGTGLTASDALSNELDELLEYAFHDLGFNYIYGSQGAKGRIEAGANYRDKSYQNYREISATQGSKFNDFAAVTGHGEFYLRLSPVTHWLVGSRILLKDYDHQRPATANGDDQNKGSDSYFYYTGFSWSVSGKTEGIARFGYQQKKFDASGKEDFQGFSWNVGLNWLPQEQSSFDFKTSQAAIDPDQQGDYNLQTLFSLKFKHNWNSRLSSTLSTAYTMDDYSNGLRDEELLALGVDGTYQFRRWLGLTAFYKYEDNDSTNSSYQYSQNVFGVSLHATL